MTFNRLLVVAFISASVLFFKATFAQSPSDDGRCDILLDATPSLYGLCLAYWATQGNGNSNASSNILAKYVEKYNPDVDPYMPGLGCPCWTPEELVSWESNRTGGLSCLQDSTQAGWFDNTGYAVWTYMDASDGPYHCQANAPSPGSGLPAIYRVEEDITEIEFNACFIQATASLENVGCT